MTSGGNNFNDFPDNQLKKLRVFIFLSQIFIPRHLIYISIASRFVHPMHERPWQTQRRNRQKNKHTNWRTCLFVSFFVCSFVCVLDGVWHLRVAKALGLLAASARGGRESATIWVFRQPTPTEQQQIFCLRLLLRFSFFFSFRSCRWKTTLLQPLNLAIYRRV